MCVLVRLVMPDWLRRNAPFQGEVVEAISEDVKLEREWLQSCMCWFEESDLPDSEPPSQNRAILPSCYAVVAVHVRHGRRYTLRVWWTGVFLTNSEKIDAVTKWLPRVVFLFFKFPLQNDGHNTLTQKVRIATNI